MHRNRPVWERGERGDYGMELTVATVLVAFAGVFLICFMKGAFGGGFSIVTALKLLWDGVSGYLE